MLFHCQQILVEHFLNNSPTLLAIFGQRDMDYHHLVCWPNFHLSCYHFHSKFSPPPLFFFNARSSCLTLLSMAILPCFQGDNDNSRLAHGYNLGDAAYYW